MTATERIRDEVRQLPIGERVRLVKYLEDDLDTEDVDVESAWDAEELSRTEEIVSGKVKLQSRGDLNRRLDEIRAKYTA